MPLCLGAPEAEWEYTLRDSGSEIVVVSESLTGRVSAVAERLDLRVVPIDECLSFDTDLLDPDCGLDASRRALILYTSGTTSRPKGVVSTHANIEAQIKMLVEAWAWRDSDRVPLFLPLHHVHGLINVLSCALWSGGCIEPFEGLQLSPLLRRVREGAYSVFMAVPTVYVKLISAIEETTELDRKEIVAGFSGMRLMVSGSAALPVSVHQRWSSLTGQVLLERYGMTEIGMALSNPLDGERRAGAVGIPLPGVTVALRSETGALVDGEDVPGEILVRGPAVFREYWQREQATEEVFSEGWFRTGDMAIRERGYFRIMGRLSIDIIKSGGYKLSALEIESVLLDHPAIRECAVLGIADETWGEIVSAAVVLGDQELLALPELREWCQSRLAPYKIPRRLAVLETLPRNAMGKVTKPALKDCW